MEKENQPSKLPEHSGELKIITKRANGTKRVVSVPHGPTRTQRQYKDQCNVNNIIAKFKKTGSVTHVRNAQEGVYADLADLPDLMEAQKIVIAATSAFENVPAHIRKRFSNDPNEFINFLQDPANSEEAIKLGLVAKKPEPKVDPVVEEIKTLGKTLASSLKMKVKTKQDT